MSAHSEQDSGPGTSTKSTVHSVAFTGPDLGQERMQQSTSAIGEPHSREPPSEAADLDIVFWDGEDDPDNPYNWPTWRKVVNGGLLSLLAFLTPVASSFLAPGVPQILQEFGSDSDVLAGFVVSVYVLGFAFGPLVIAPTSEIYGRSIVYHVSNACFTAFMVACALAPSLGSLIAFRFFSGVFGSAPLANASGSIADMISQEKRAAAVGACTVGPLLGPIIGPVVGGFLSEAAGWRWVFWVLAIASGCLTLIMLILMKESYAPLILQCKVRRLKKETGNALLQSKLDKSESRVEYFKRGIIRPAKIFFKSPLVQIYSVYMAVVYGDLYLLFTTITQVFQQTYGFSTHTVGMVYLGLGVGMIMGLIIYAISSDRSVKRDIAARRARGDEGPAKPELRLAPLPIGAILLPIGFFVYGWTAEYQVHWIVPILGMALIGIGNFFAFMAINMYLVDAYVTYTASALAAITVMRSIGGALLPLAGLEMYNALGLGWGNTLLGFVGVALIPIPFLFMRYGEFLREKYQINDL